MKKSTKITLIVIIAIAIIAIISTIVMMQRKNGKANLETLNVSTTEEMKDLVEKIYKGVEVFPTLETAEVDLNDKDMVENITGLKKVEDIDSIVVSEPMMSSQAYSMVLAKVKENTDIEKIAKEMNESVNPNKWICVSAEKVYTTSSGNIVFLVMSAEDIAKPVFENFKKIANDTGKEYERTYEETIPEL